MFRGTQSSRWRCVPRVGGLLVALALLTVSAPGCTGELRSTGVDATSSTRRAQAEATLAELIDAMERGDETRTLALLSPRHMDTTLVPGLPDTELIRLASLLRQYSFYADLGAAVEFRAPSPDLANQSVMVFFEDGDIARVAF